MLDFGRHLWIFLACSFRVYREGEAVAFPGCTMVMEGNYFAWPRWRKVLSRVVVVPYGLFQGAHWTLSRMVHRPWSPHEHVEPRYYCVSLAEMFNLGCTMASHHILPVAWAVEFDKRG